jgi:hypothetical protein
MNVLEKVPKARESPFPEILSTSVLETDGFSAEIMVKLQTQDLPGR